MISSCCITYVVVFSRLKTRWHVETVPAGKGAFPMKTCEKMTEG